MTEITVPTYRYSKFKIDVSLEEKSSQINLLLQIVTEKSSIQRRIKRGPIFSTFVFGLPSIHSAKNMFNNKYINAVK